MSNSILTNCQYQNYRRIDLIVIHCSATRATQRYTMDDCRRDHRARGFAGIGYDYYITRNGVVMTSFVHACVINNNKVLGSSMFGTA